MSHPCDRAVEEMYYYLDGEMSFYRRIRVRWHLRKCGSCCGAFDFETGVKNLIRQKSHTEPSAELIERLRTLLREEAGDDVER